MKGDGVGEEKYGMGRLLYFLYHSIFFVAQKRLGVDRKILKGGSLP